MVKRKQGKIILIGSVAGKETYPNGNVYCATKHAVDALARGMRMDLISHGVQVSAIHPGMVETEFSMVRFDGDRERANAVYNNMTPLKGIDVAKAVTWMIHSPEHVHIADVVIYPAVQASATIVNRSNS
jgi:NADP-dependent 3-hydroxy acid dehydrogenase YdfG